MSLPRRFRLLLLVALTLLALPGSPALATSDFARFKDLKNDFLKVIDIRERERTEERYVESDGKVSLQKLPYKEVQVTAELTQKPPSSLDTMFSADQPYLKICLAPFDAEGKAMEEDCQPVRFQSLIKGNVGTAAFRLAPEMARYEFRLTQKVPDKGASIKLWAPTK